MNLSTSKSYTKINKRFDWLDGVRGCAILFVVIFHSVEVLPKDSLLRYFFSFGQYGVQLFFVVSALTCVLTLKKNKIIDWYIRRFIRIALIYYIGIIIYYPIFKLEAIIGVKSDEFSNLKNIVANIFFIHGWVPSANNNVVPGGWSIAVEMNFYLIAPFIVLLGSKTKYGVIILNIFLILSLLLFNYIYNFPVVNNSFEYFWPINQLPVFFIVIALYYCSKNFWDEIDLSFLKIGLGLIFIFLAVFIGVYKNINNILAPTLVGCGFYIFILGLGYHRRLFEIKPLIFLGRISFSLYIVHFAFEHFFRFIVHILEKNYQISILVYLLVIVLIILFSVITAQFMYNKIEVKYTVLSEKIIDLKNTFLERNIGKN